jgi:hypothetical protein
MRNLTILVILLAFTASGWAEDDKPVLVYAGPRADGPITLDGALDEPAWQSAPLASGFTLFGSGNEPAAQTSFRLVYDDEALYLGVTGDEPAMDRVAPTSLPRDEHGVFGQECIEFFIDPKHSHSQYHQIAANLAGSVYDSEYENVSWNGTTRVVGQRGEKSWTMEWRIPWADFGIQPQPGLLLGFNVCRDRYVGPDREWTNWSQTIGGFHDPFRFAHLVLSPTVEQLGQRREAYRQGGRSGPLRFYVPDELSGQVYRPLVRQAIAEVEVLLDEIEAAQAKAPNDPANAEIAKEVKSLRDRIATLRAQSAQEIDADEWIQIDLELVKMARNMDTIIWEARLRALLAEI